MTFFENVGTVEDRAAAMPHMEAFLKAIAGMEASLSPRSAEAVWRRVTTREPRSMWDHIYAAREAGLIEASREKGGPLRLTPKGRETIGATAPMWVTS